MTDKTRINLNITNTMLKAIDVYANSLGVNRTSAIIFLLNTALTQQTAIDSFQVIQQLADNNTLSNSKNK